MPAAAAALFLVRHGRTALNAAGALRGHLDPPLDEVGRGDAERLGALFATVPPSRIVSSPLTRAQETARAISDRSGVPVEVDPELIDRDYGPVAGRAQHEVEAELGPLDSIAGVEPLDAVAARVAGAVDRLAGQPSAERLLVVAHDIVNRLLLWRFAPDRFANADAVPQRTGCWNRLERTGDGWHVLVVDALPGVGHVPR